MERVAFLIEQSGQRIPCLLNPDSVVIQRRSGVRSRHSGQGVLTRISSTDDQLIFTGGGLTELQLDLLFDVWLISADLPARQEPASQMTDVRDLTAPLWELADNPKTEDGYGTPPLSRFVWGKSWNILGVIMALSERLERFDSGGTPQRSWLRIRFRRVSEPTTPPEMREGVQLPNPGQEVPSDLLHVYEVIGADKDRQPGESERLDELAFRFYKDAAAWKALANYNNIDNPLDLPGNLRLQIPPPSGGVTRK